MIDNDCAAREALAQQQAARERQKKGIAPPVILAPLDPSSVDLTLTMPDGNQQQFGMMTPGPTCLRPVYNRLVSAMVQL